MAANTYDVGDLVRCSVVFEDAVGTNIDPDTVAVKVKPPTGATVTYTYGTDVAVVREATGVFHIDVPATVAGEWWFRWASTGTGQAAGEREFLVKVSEF
jgi:hypothetical protein